MIFRGHPMLLRALRGLAVAAILIAGATGAAQAAIIDAIEYYNANLDHYFYTTNPVEINALDSGVLVGWQRTGLSFKVFDATSPAPGSVPVCRFYGRPSAGLDSHFITANADECNLLKQPPYNSAWLLESADVFEVFLPDFATGQCPAGTVPVYRTWDHRPDSDHRYTTDPAVDLAMVAMGSVAEGYGVSATPTSMCSPTAAPSGVPVCSPSASDAAPYVGAVITVFSQCSGNPTSYAWSGCTSTSGHCTATSSVNGPQTYTVVATNSSGASAPASVTVSWHKLPPPPICSLIVTANSNLPVVGSQVLLAAVCSGGAPTTYTWGGCASGGNNCVTVSAAAGVQMYSVIATNAGGMGAPAFASVNWQASPAAAPGFCGQFPSYLFTDDGWVSTRLISRDFTGDPGFAWNGVWVVKLTVPIDATPDAAGAVTVAEFGGPTTTRQMTISRFPCDFRPDDPTGSNGPLAQTENSTTRIGFVLGAGSAGSPGLTPGQVYYVNVRNWETPTSTISCDPAIGRCEAFMDVFAPR